MKFPAILLSGLLAISSLHAQLQRSWTSKDGTATVEATFQKVDGDNVVLILPNGRSQTIKKQFLCDSDIAWIEENDTKSAIGASEGAQPGDPIPSALAGNLIDERGNPVDLAAKKGGYPKFYMFYYSASWCGPCCHYTPEVVRMAKRMNSDSFTVILVPNDRSLEDEIAYLKDYRMPWPGLKWSKSGYKDIPGNPGGGIPAARLTDAKGKTLLTTEDVNRTDFLDEVRKIVKNGGKES